MDDAPGLRGVRTFPFTRIVGLEHIRFGQHVIVDDFVFIYATDEHVIGDYVHIASFTSITGGGRLLMADFTTVSSGCRILTGTDDFVGGGLVNSTIPLDLRPVRRGRVVLEKHVVIGANSVVLPDVTVGEGTAVGAGSVVTRDLEPWGIYAGSPARRLRDRPRERVVEGERLLRSRNG